MPWVTGNIGDILGSPAWTAAATLLALATIVLTLYLYRRGRSRKSLTFSQKATQLVSIHDEARGKIAINYEGEYVEQVFLIEVHLKNSGNEPVLPSDFLRPLTLELGKATAMTVDLARAKPSGLSPIFEIEDHRVRLSPLLLNPGDELSFKVLLRDYEREPRLSYRIVGVSKLVDERELEQRREKWRWLTTGDAFIAIGAVGLMVVGLSALTSGWLLKRENQSPTPRAAHALITLKDPHGERFCGDVLRLDDEKLTFRRLYRPHSFVIPTKRVASIRKNMC
jgi:hypothetical protein